MARVCRRLAHWQQGSGIDPRPLLAAGREAVERAVEVAPGDPWCLAERAALAALSATVDPSGSQAPQLRAQAAADLDRAVAINPQVARRYRPLVDGSS
jgi:hypothetical protein